MWVSPISVGNVDSLKPDVLAPICFGAVFVVGKMFDDQVGYCGERHDERYCTDEIYVHYHMSPFMSEAAPFVCKAFVTVLI